MGVLTDVQISTCVENGTLGIDNFDRKCLRAASYDLRLGEHIFLSKEDAPKKLKRGDSVTLAPGDFALVQPFERLELPADVRGRIGLRSRYSLAGLINLSGPQIDPGFHGYLTLGLVNIGPTQRTLKFLDRLFTVEFDRLEQSCNEPYSGEFEEVEGIPSFLVQTVAHGSSISLPALATKLTVTEERVESLQKMFYYVGLPLVFGLLAAVVGFLLQR